MKREHHGIHYHVCIPPIAALVGRGELTSSPTAFPLCVCAISKRVSQVQLCGSMEGDNNNHVLKYSMWGTCLRLPARIALPVSDRLTSMVTRDIHVTYLFGSCCPAYLRLQLSKYLSTIQHPRYNHLE